jgi:hypothetical protein
MDRIRTKTRVGGGKVRNGRYQQCDFNDASSNLATSAETYTQVVHLEGQRCYSTTQFLLAARLRMTRFILHRLIIVASSEVSHSVVLALIPTILRTFVLPHIVLVFAEHSQAQAARVERCSIKEHVDLR